MSINILVYNNNTGIMEVMRPLLIGEGYSVMAVNEERHIEKLLEENKVQLLITDIELTNQDGIIAIQSIRKESSVPIIVVSKRDDEKDKISALNMGADDYVVYPCNPLELLARVKSQLRRYTQLANMNNNVERIYQINDLVIDDITRKVTIEGREVKLTPIEYKILKLLVQERGRVFSIEQIYETIWHMQAIGADNTIAVHIRHIREKIERNPKEPQYLKVVWGTGYKVG